MSFSTSEMPDFLAIIFIILGFAATGVVLYYMNLARNAVS